MLAKPFDIHEPLLLTSPVYQDNRGYFIESVHARGVRKADGYDPEYDQDNLSNSCEAGTLRGLHPQRPPFANRKLIQMDTEVLQIPRTSPIRRKDPFGAQARPSFQSP